MIVFANTKLMKVILVDENSGESKSISMLDTESIKELLKKYKDIYWINSIKKEKPETIINFVKSYVEKNKNNKMFLKKYIHTKGKKKIIIPSVNSGKFLEFNGIFDFKDYNFIMSQINEFPSIKDAISNGILEVVNEFDKNIIIQENKSKVLVQKEREKNKDTKSIVLPVGMKAEEVAAMGIPEEGMDEIIDLSGEGNDIE